MKIGDVARAWGVRVLVPCDGVSGCRERETDRGVFSASAKIGSATADDAATSLCEAGAREGSSPWRSDAVGVGGEDTAGLLIWVAGEEPGTIGREDTSLRAAALVRPESWRELVSPTVWLVPLERVTGTVACPVRSVGLRASLRADFLACACFYAEANSGAMAWESQQQVARMAAMKSGESTRTASTRITW